jgi:hypothetical protein
MHSMTDTTSAFGFHKSLAVDVYLAVRPARELALPAMGGQTDNVKLCKFAMARPAAGIFVANDIETRLLPSENEASNRARRELN